MNWKSVVRELIGGAKQASRAEFPISKSLEPIIPEPKYVCQNCGMLIETMHKHTREECKAYQNNSTNPDLRAHKIILPGRNDPKVKLPYYYESDEK